MSHCCRQLHRLKWIRKSWPLFWLLSAVFWTVDGERRGYVIYSCVNDHPVIMNGQTICGMAPRLNANCQKHYFMETLSSSSRPCSPSAHILISRPQIATRRNILLFFPHCPLT
jgi:hypothetical protein